MGNLRYLTSGESHGPAVLGVIEGIPSGLEITEDLIKKDLARRQGGYGRGGRMKIETDHAKILSGVRWGKTIGGPISLMIENRDWKNWDKGMSPRAEDAGSIPPVIRPRPGHADLAGILKYDLDDIRNVLERSSARETAGRVALGAVARAFLMALGVKVTSYVRSIGPAGLPDFFSFFSSSPSSDLETLIEKTEGSDLRCPDPDTTERMRAEIDLAIAGGYSLGGIFEVIAVGLPPGLGSHIQWDRRLDGRLSQALMGIQAIKGVEVGLGFEMARRPGSEVMDEIFYNPGEGFSRRTNNAGGIEGGMSTGMPIVLRAAMKPIPTLRRPLRSVDIRTHEQVEAAYERSDVCAVPAAGVVAEAMVSLTLADEILIKFGGDSMAETGRNLKAYMERVAER